MKFAFKQVQSFKYEISDDGLTIYDNYFTGILPCALSTEFRCDSLWMGNSSMGSLFFEADVVCNISALRAGYAEILADFTDGTFSGKVFCFGWNSEGTEENWFSKGLARGTYEVTGTGYDECTLKLKFTELPEYVLSEGTWELNKEYTLTREAIDSDYQYKTTYSLNDAGV